jgi:hypothetical protein
MNYSNKLISQNNTQEYEESEHKVLMPGKGGLLHSAIKGVAGSSLIKSSYH